MFDLTSLIRQLLPPHRRQPLTIALARILFGPALAIMNALVATRARLMDQVLTTGQTIVLENLLSRTISSQTGGTVYLAEGNDPSVDFSVIVPENLPTSAYGELIALVDRYKQAGKRYAIVKGVTYASNGNTIALAWERGYPYAKDKSLFIAVNQVGTFFVRVADSNGKVYTEGNIPFRLGTITEVSPIDPELTYTISVGSITASVRVATSFLTAQVGYDWNAGGRALFLGFNASEAPNVVLVKPDGTLVSQTSQVFGVTFNGISYGYRAYFTGLPSGRYLVRAAVPGKDLSYTGYITLTDSNSGQGLVINGNPPVDNQAPIINKQVARQTAKVGTPYSQTIPADTFADSDGTIGSVAISGLPAGLSGQVSGLSVIVSGTPTTAGDYTVSVTATDNQNASVIMRYVVAVAANVVTPVEPPRPDLPTLQGILKTDLRPQDYGLLEIVLDRYDSATGEYFLKDKSTRNADPGKTWMYHVQGTYYTRSQFEAASWPPFFPILVYKYGVDTGKDRHLWREQPTVNDAQKVRYI